MDTYFIDEHFTMEYIPDYCKLILPLNLFEKIATNRKGIENPLHTYVSNVKKFAIQKKNMVIIPSKREVKKQIELQYAQYYHKSIAMKV